MNTTRLYAGIRTLCAIACIALATTACTQDSTPSKPFPTPQVQKPIPEEAEELDKPEEDTTGKAVNPLAVLPYKNLFGDNGSLDIKASTNPPKVDGEMVDKINAKNIGVNKALGVNLLGSGSPGSGPLRNTFGTGASFSSRMNVAMSGEGNSLVVARGAGGMGTRGTGRGGGGDGVGRIHGMGKVDTGGGRGVNAKLGKPTGARKTPQRGPAKKPAPVEPERETFQNPGVNPFVSTDQDKLSTFAVDVDTASYAIVRSRIQNNLTVSPASVRVEEFINAFTYDYTPPETSSTPFKVHFEGAPSPFNDNTHFVRIGIQGKTIDESQRKPAHLTFLVDVSGSMQSPEKLGMAVEALTILTKNLKPTDTVAISTYAGHVAQVLPPTPASRKATILKALQSLSAGGSTAMSDGLALAYKLAAKSFKKGHINRVVVLSDGDANVGSTSYTDILKRIEQYTKKGITLSTIGFGYRSYNDHMMEQLANKGNGNYYFIDSNKEARKVFTRNLTGTLQVIAKDVKTQVDFNPNTVESYRLVGYENRNVADRDFRNDKVDAGEIGAGHQVTAIYQLRLRSKNPTAPLATVHLRHKTPTGTKATESKTNLTTTHLQPHHTSTSPSYKLAFSAMSLAEKLRHSSHALNWSWNTILQNVPTPQSTRRPDETRELKKLIKHSHIRSKKNL